MNFLLFLSSLYHYYMILQPGSCGRIPVLRFCFCGRIRVSCFVRRRAAVVILQISAGGGRIRTCNLFCVSCFVIQIRRQAAAAIFLVSAGGGNPLSAIYFFVAGGQRMVSGGVSFSCTSCVRRVKIGRRVIYFTVSLSTRRPAQAVVICFVVMFLCVI